MNYRRFALVVAFSAALSAPAFSASVVMLQFGSFETRDEAQARLVEVKAKHADALGGIPAAIREVTLPPDNLTVYRTQAGPVASRAAAQSICAKLSGNGDECYVVETAMIAAPNAAVASAAAPVAIPAPAPVAPVTALPAAAPVATSMALPNAQVPAADTNAPALAPLAAVDATPAQPSVELQAAMDRAIANQQTAFATAPTPVASQPRPAERSFWSRMNPFSSDTPAAPSVKPAAAIVPLPIPAPASAPVEAVAVAPLPAPAGAPLSARVPALAPMAAAEPMAAPALVAIPTPVPAAAPAPIPAPASAPMPTLAPAPVPMAAVAPAPHLPPPPAPLMAQNPATFAAPQPVPMPVPVPVRPVPVQQAMVAPIAQPTPAPSIAVSDNQPFKSSPSVPVGGGEMAASNQGNVSVEEAKRVPLTESSAPILPMAVQAPVSLSPSSTVGLKTFWAQIGQFPDTQTALAYWDSFRQVHPDFPVVRVRVAAPLRAPNDRVSLRVGPFARDAFITSLCSSVQAPDANGQVPPLQCGRVVDLGVAASTSNVPGLLPGSRYNR